MTVIPVILKILAEYTFESQRMYMTCATVRYPKRTGLPEENRAAIEGFWHMPSQSASENDPPESTSLIAVQVLARDKSPSS